MDDNHAATAEEETEKLLLNEFFFEIQRLRAESDISSLEDHILVGVAQEANKRKLSEDETFILRCKAGLKHRLHDDLLSHYFEVTPSDAPPSSEYYELSTRSFRRIMKELRAGLNAQQNEFTTIGLVRAPASVREPCKLILDRAIGDKITSSDREVWRYEDFTDSWLRLGLDSLSVRFTVVMLTYAVIGRSDKALQALAHRNAYESFVDKLAGKEATLKDLSREQFLEVAKLLLHLLVFGGGRGRPPPDRAWPDRRSRRRPVFPDAGAGRG